MELWFHHNERLCQHNKRSFQQNEWLFQNNERNDRLTQQMGRNNRFNTTERYNRFNTMEQNDPFNATKRKSNSIWMKIKRYLNGNGTEMAVPLHRIQVGTVWWHLRRVCTGASKLDWCGLNLHQSCLHLIHIHVAQKWIVSRLKLDWANPRTVGWLDLDRKWIITGNTVFTWQSHSLIEAHVCRRCQAVLVGGYKERTHCCMYGEQTGPDPAGCDIQKQLCTSKWQVCYHIIGPCVRVVTSLSL